MTTCEYEPCGIEFTPKYARYFRFCCREHSIAQQKYEAALAAPARAEKAARLNAEKKERNKKDRQRKKDNPTFKLQCEECDKEFLWHRKGKRYCSPSCGIRHLNRLKYQKGERKCKGCGTPFTPVYGDKRRDYCSPECRRRTFVRIGKATRRAREKAARIESVDPMKVFARDKWRCHLCGVSTPKRLRGTLDDRAPELDHVVPLAAGGAHSYANTACACRACNIKKGATPKGQPSFDFAA